MFDTYTTSVAHPRQPDVHHHEHRAPTDESVELLREMEEAALAKILDSVRLESNEFTCAWSVHENAYDMSRKAICQFVLNGKKHRVEVELLRGIHADGDSIANLVLEAVTREVAMQLTLPLFQSAQTRKQLQS